CPARSESPSRSSTAVARTPRSAVGTPYRAAQTSRFSSTLKWPYRWDSWPIQPMARRPPATRARPCCGRISPASTLRRVVLPAPLGPKIASVCPGASVNDTPSSATTRPYVCRRPSAESIDARGEIFHVERLHQVARMAQVEHVDQRLHADVRRGDDHGERGPGLA